MPRDVPLLSIATNPLAVEAAERQRVVGLMQQLQPLWRQQPDEPWFVQQTLSPGVVLTSNRPVDAAALRSAIHQLAGSPLDISRLDGSAVLVNLVRTALFHSDLTASVAFQQRALTAGLIADIGAQGITRRDVDAGMTSSYERWPERASDLPPSPTQPILNQLADGLCVRHGVATPEQGFLRQKSRLPKDQAEWLRAATQASEKLNFPSLVRLEEFLLILATTLVVTAENEQTIAAIISHLQRLVPTIYSIQEILDGNTRHDARAILERAAQYRGAAVRSQSVVTQHRAVPADVLAERHAELLRNRRHELAGVLLPALQVFFSAAGQLVNLENALVAIGHDLTQAKEIAATSSLHPTIEAHPSGLYMPAPRRLLTADEDGLPAYHQWAVA